VAAAEDVPVYLDEIGKCVAREVVAIQPQVSGRIMEIHVTDGAEVKVGDVLFTIDPRPYQAQVDSAAAACPAPGRARLGQDRIHPRETELMNVKSVSRSDLDVKKNAVAVAEAQINQAGGALETSKLNLDYCSIRSPIMDAPGNDWWISGMS
jgi:RND family efflux transporter MFP subunit